MTSRSVELSAALFADQVRSLLAEGMTLSRELGQRNIEQATLTAILPVLGLTVPEVTNLRDAVSIPEANSREREGRALLISSVGPEDVEFGLRGHLASSSSLVVFEHPFLLPSDPRLGAIDDKWVVNDEVYTLLRAPSSPTAVRDALALATTYLLLAVETSMPTVLDKPDATSLGALAIAASGFWLRAFDREGYVHVSFDRQPSKSPSG